MNNICEMSATGFVSNSTIFELPVEALPEFLLVDDADDDSSVHASTVFGTDTEARRLWFQRNLVIATEWELITPGDIPMHASPKFEDHKGSFEPLGFKCWNIGNKQQATSYLKLRSQTDPTAS